MPAPSTENAEAIQAKIDALQKALHTAVSQSDFTFDEQRSAIVAERDAAVAAMIASKELPSDFWASAVIAYLTLHHKSSETATHFLGPYDEKLLRQYLQDVKVVFAPKGFRLTMTFRENPFFEGKELWAEVRRVAAKETEESEDAKKDKDDEDDEDDDVEDEGFEFSGITWKPGHGPEEGDDSDEEDEGRKRAREGTSSSGTQGPTMLEVFSVMSPYPEDDEELDDLDEDDLADAMDEWEDELNDRKQLLALLAEEMVANPHAAIRGLAQLDGVVDEVMKKVKTE